MYVLRSSFFCVLKSNYTARFIFPFVKKKKKSHYVKLYRTQSDLSSQDITAFSKARHSVLWLYFAGPCASNSGVPPGEFVRNASF